MKKPTKKTSIKKKSTRKPVVVPYTVVCVGNRLWDVTRTLKVADGKSKRNKTIVDTPFQQISDETLAHGLAHFRNKQLNAN